MNLDGDFVKVWGDHLDLSKDVASVADVVINGIRREFTAGPLWWGEAVATDAGVVLAEEYDYQGGRLRMGAVEQVFPPVQETEVTTTSWLRLCVWEGRQYSLHTHLYGTDEATFFGILDLFKIIETDRGIRLKAVDPRRTPLHKETAVLKDVPGLGLINTVRLTRESARGVPARKGTSVRGGELFLEEVESSESPGFGFKYFILVGKNTKTHVSPHPSESDDTVLHALEELEVDLERGQP
ncbi:MAG: hypothetical protein ABR613_13320 [Actinomycetota bacterium]